VHTGPAGSSQTNEVFRNKDIENNLEHQLHGKNTDAQKASAY
jgi:hypothetical protein